MLFPAHGECGSFEEKNMEKSRLICIAGPTGSGKTAASLHLAQQLMGCGRKPVIINADSRQTYADFPIITAQPSEVEQATCPHLLYGYLATSEKTSAGRWAEKAGAVIEEAFANGQQPVLVGGTGLYMRALLDGMAEIPEPKPDVSVRLEAECAKRGPQSLHKRLGTIDPDYAARIHPNDRQRVVRALEVWESTGRTFTAWHQSTPKTGMLGERLNDLAVLRLGVGLSLTELTPMLASRIRTMLNAGALEEARAALRRYPDTSAPGWTGIGCAETAAHLTGNMTLDTCIAQWTQNTRAYAKRQWTWFRADPRLSWYSPHQNELLTAQAMAFLNS